MFALTCQYCNSQWKQDYVYKTDLHCKTCKDRNIRVIDTRVDKIDYYEGSPPFPPKKEPITYDNYL